MIFRNHCFRPALKTSNVWASIFLFFHLMMRKTAVKLLEGSVKMVFKAFILVSLMKQ